MAEVKKTTNSKQFQGVVTSTKMAKTAVVKIDSTKIHPKYLKRFSVSRKFKIHDELNACRVGNLVTFEECRPMSKDKRWRLKKIVK